MLLLPLLLFIISQTMRAMENSALYRNPTGDFSVGEFAQNSFHYLWVKKITSSKVADQFDCTFLCVGESKCFSFNVAAYPDLKGLYLCELLATDKYRATEKFHANATFHHYSPRVRVFRSDNNNNNNNNNISRCLLYFKSTLKFNISRLLFYFKST